MNVVDRLKDIDDGFKLPNKNNTMPLLGSGWK
jgi:hypothetical protein